MDFIKQAGKIFLNDSKSFKKVIKKEKWVKPFLTIILFSFVVSFFDVGIYKALYLLLATIVLGFISVGILHKALKYFGGVGNFKQTLAVNFNIQLFPTVVLSILALIGIIISLFSKIIADIIGVIIIFLAVIYFPWFIILMTQGLSESHKVSFAKSYISQLISLLLSSIFGVAFLIGFVAIFLLPDPTFQQKLIDIGIYLK